MRVDRVNQTLTPIEAPPSSPIEPGTFQTLLESRLKRTGLEFSKHALERLEQRSIQVSSDTLERLSESARRAESKGAKTTLILIGDLAFVVSVENKRVITVAEQSSLQERVFTNIDSVVVG